jgi:Protein of unknown function (DUF3617)
MTTRFLIAVLAAAAVLISPAAQALEIQPGLWQDTETGEVNGQPQPPKVTTDCIKPEDAKDPVKAAQAQMKDMDAKQCSKSSISQSGNQMIFEMKCGDPKQGSMDVSVIWTFLDAQHTSTVAKSVMAFGGQKMTSNLKTESKWIAAACAK